MQSQNKRVFGGGQGDRDDPDPMRASRDANDPPQRATADIIKGRRIAAPRSRRGGASGFSSRENSVDRQLGNPFAPVPNAQGNNSNNTNGSLFSGFGQPQQSTPAFGSSTSSQSFPAGNNIFGQQQSSSFTFGANSQQTSSSFPPPSNAAGQQQTSTPAFSFGASSAAPSGGSAFTFGSANQQNSTQPSAFNFGSGASASTPINNPFSGLLKNGVQPQATPTPPSNPFSFGSNSAAAPNEAAPASSNIVNTDDMMTSPPITPEKQAPAASTTPASKPPVFQMSQGLFGNASTPAPAQDSSVKETQASPFQSSQSPANAQASQTPATFGQDSSQARASSPFAPQPATAERTAAPSTSLFSSAPTAPTSLFGSTPAAPTNPFASASTPAAASPAPPTLFKSSTPLPPTTPSLFAPSSAASTATPAPVPAATPSTVVNAKTTNGSASAMLIKARAALREFNQSFKAHISSLNEENDWTPMLKTYMMQMERLRDSIRAKTDAKRPLEAESDQSQPNKRSRASPPAETVATPSSKQPAAPQFAAATPSATPSATSLFGSGSAQSTTPTSSPSKSQTANLFASIVGNTPQQQDSTPQQNLFGTPTTETPAPASNLFTQQKTPATSSNNIFATTPAAATPKPATSTADAAQPSNPFANLAKGPSPTSFLKNPPSSAVKSSESPVPVPSPFSASAARTPSQTNGTNLFAQAQSSKPAIASAAPSMPVFEMPKFSAPSGADAFAQFGAQAEKQQQKSEEEAEKKELEKRFDADYDSDEETESAFNKRVLAEIRAERAKAKEAKASAPARATFDPAKGFSFGSASTSSEKTAESQETPPSSAEAAPNSFKPSFAATPSATPGKSIFASTSMPSAPTTNLFGHLAQTQNQAANEDDSDDEPSNGTPASNESAGKSLFDRISKPENSTSTPSNADADAGDKSHSVNGTAHKASPFAASTSFGASTSEDHTWKADSPIKFGASSGASSTPTKSNGTAASTTPATKPFTNIFGELKPNATPSLFGQSPLKPATGFNFGASTNGSVATASESPASTREGSVQNGVDDGASGDSSAEVINLDGVAPDAQVSLSDLTAEERSNNELLFEVTAARVQVYDTKTKSWERRGTGPLRVLKSKETGLIQILGRSNPQGKVLINSPLLKGLSYENPAKGRVKLPAVVQGNKVTTMLITVKEEETAKKLAQLCEDNKPK